MEVLTFVAWIVIAISVALLYPPLFLFCLIIIAPKYGIWPIILYLYFISMVYYVKNKGKN